MRARYLALGLMAGLAAPALASSDGVTTFTLDNGMVMVEESALRISTPLQ